MNTIKKTQNLRTFLVLMIALTMSFIFIGCNEDSTSNQDNTIVDYNDMEGFFEANQVEAQEFTIDISVESVITGDDGTVVTIPANAFLNADNTLATGNIVVKMREIFKASDMILSNKPTNAIGFNNENTFLLSEGETEIVATKDGNALTLNQETPLSIQVPATAGSDGDMLPFEGTTSQEEGVIWNPNFMGGDGIVYNATPSSFTYQSFATGWSNCDKFYSYSGTKTINYVDLYTSPNASETSVFIAFKENGLPAVVKLFTLYADGVKSYANSLPVGLEVTFVAISVQDNRQYMATLKKNIVSNDVISFEFNPVTNDELVATLENLD